MWYTSNGIFKGSHCIQRMIAIPQITHYVFWFKTFYMEEAYDNVTVQNLGSFDIVKMSPGHFYIAPALDLILQFDSDGSITQAGFEVIIQEYEVEGQSDCESNWVSIHYNISYTPMIDFIIGPVEGFYWNSIRLVVHGDFYIKMFGYPFYGIINATDLEILFTLLRIPEPKLIDSLILNETLTYAFYDLTTIENNSYIKILNELPENQIIDYFFVTNNTYGLFDAYEGFFEKRISLVENIIKSCVNFKDRQFMPKGCIIPSRDNLIYAEEQDKNNKVLMFARIRYLETKSCLFEHNVIDTKLLSKVNGTLTMTNNGTGEPCPVYILNPFRNGRIYLDSIWTNSAMYPIEIYNETDLVLTFTKFDKINRFSLETTFYRIIVPVGASFTAVAYDTEQNLTESTVNSTCPDGTQKVPPSIRGKWRCLLFYKYNHVFSDAEMLCKQNNGHLISVENGVLNQYIAELWHSLYGSGSFWIGVTNVLDGVWRNIDDGTNITYSNWDTGYPVNNSDYACVHVTNTGVWINADCNKSRPLFVCGVFENENEKELVL
ncbi:hypothetical protein FO519_009587 [Halicephalobus sp. NKZ332]|nr:hypothetical protein FO519_009587 [Halicephalobus sp. NKZ332]